MVQGVLIDKAIEVLFQRARDFGRSPRARAIDETLRTVVGKAIDPLAEGGIGKREGVRNGLQALAFDDLAHGLGTAEDAGFPGLLDEGISGRERVIGKVQCEGPHLRVSSNKILQKYTNPTPHDVFTLLSAHNLSDSNFPEPAHTLPQRCEGYGGSRGCPGDPRVRRGPRQAAGSSSEISMCASLCVTVTSSIANVLQSHRRERGPQRPPRQGPSSLTGR